MLVENSRMAIVRDTELIICRWQRRRVSVLVHSSLFVVNTSLVSISKCFLQNGIALLSSRSHFAIIATNTNHSKRITFPRVSVPS